MNTGIYSWWLSWQRICLQCRRPHLDSWVGKICWRRDRLPTPVFLSFPVVQLVKNLPAMWETWVWSLGWSISWRRERIPTPVFWPGECYGLSLWGRKESDMIERLSLSLFRVETYKHKILQESVPARETWTVINELLEAPCGHIWELKTPGRPSHSRTPTLLWVLLPGISNHRTIGCFHHLHISPPYY